MITDVLSNESDSLRRIKDLQCILCKRKSVQYSILELFLSMYFKYRCVHRLQSVT